MRRRITLLAFYLLCGWLPNASLAGVTFFVNDEVGFNTATAGMTLLGSEDWSSAGSAPAEEVGEPLLPGVANGVFPNGVTASTGMTVQSNTLGLHAATVSMGDNLFYAPTGFAGSSGNTQPSNQLSANSDGVGLDLLFSPVSGTDPVAVALSPMYYRTGSLNNTGNVNLAVFDDTNQLLGTAVAPNVEDVLENVFVGIVLTQADVLGRVNLWAGSLDVAGADNIQVYGAPEPSAALLLAMAGMTLAVRIGLRRA